MVKSKTTNLIRGLAWLSLAVLTFSVINISGAHVTAATLQPELVQTINPGNFNFITNVGGIAYFTANDGTHGYELWKSDGTAAGTMMVKDINPGSSGSIPMWITPVGGTLYFWADDGTHGQELWKSDGTEGGTTMVRDINPGSAGSPIATSIVSFDGAIYFNADDGVHGQELWKSDGTTSGTSLVADINPGPSGDLIYNLVVMGSALYFVANDSTHGPQVWKTNGTTVSQVSNAPANGGFPIELTNANGTLFFIMADGQAIHGRLWASDGTPAGTHEVTSTVDAQFSYTLESMGSTAYFVGNDGVSGSELWKSDGTAVGTTLVRDVNPGAGSSGAAYLTVVNDALYFVGSDTGTNGQLWKSDGTTVGTTKVSDMDPQPLIASPNFGTSGFGQANGLILFNANDGVHGNKLWQTDGTVSGTQMIDASNASNLSYDNGVLFFSNNANQLMKLQYPLAPAAPTNLNATSPTKTPQLAWSAVTGADHYDVYRDNALAGSSSTPSFTDASAADGSHAYFVRAVSTGNAASEPSNTITVLVDKTAPTITPQVNPTPNANGWNNTSPTITFTCADAGTGIASCPSPVTVATETAGQIVSGTAIDQVGNTATSSATVKLDKTSPTIANMTLTPRLVLFSGTLSIGADAADALAGISQGEYFIDTDPGTGNGIPMAYTAATGKITASYNVPAGSLSRGRHTVFVRSKDNAGNWSSLISLTFIYV